MKIKELSKVDLPREKLEKYGVQKLADHELLALLLGSGIQGTNVLELSKKILKTIKKIGRHKITLRDLLEIGGLGPAKAAQVIAVLELGSRLSAGAPDVLSPEDVWKFCADIRDSKKEHFLAFYLDTQQRLIERQIVFIGTLNATLVHPREIFEPAVALHAASIVVAHNHPSGDLSPSAEDREVTKRLAAAGDILGIDLIDHIIVSSRGWVSFDQKGWM
jgi:DNA repair protein RadC